MTARAFVGDHASCPDTLRQSMAKVGLADCTVSTLPPLVIGPYTTDPHVCPHGVAYWLEPSGEMIAQWVKDGTP